MATTPDGTPPRCLGYASRLARLVASRLEARGCDCILLSGGVDTAFVALAYAAHGRGFRLAVGAGPPGGGVDYGYALEAAGALGLRLEWEHLAPPRPGFRECIRHAALALATADPVSVAGAAAVCAALARAKAEGCECAATGDGGDELFLGYTFLHGLPRGALEAWRRRMAAGWAVFPARALARRLGLEACTPLYTPEARLLSLEVPLECLIAPGPGGRPYGKILLRLYIEAMGLPRVAWREKTPVTHGSGALRLLEDLAHREAPGPRRGWEPSPAHALLQAIHDEAGTGLPHECPDPSRRCPVCGSCMRGNHCPYCGAYKTPDGRVSVYTGPWSGRGVGTPG